MPLNDLPLPSPETDSPTYQGVSLAVHVEEESTLPSSVPPHPDGDQPTIPGTSQGIHIHLDSPSFMEDILAQIFGDNPNYNGVSDAIHVRGDPGFWPPVDPIPSCECPGGTDSTDTFQRTVTGGWGTSDAGPVWTTIQVPTRPVILSVDGFIGVYDTVGTYTGSGPTVPGIVELPLGAFTYPIDVYFESRVTGLPTAGVTNGSVSWAFGNEGTSAADAVSLTRTAVAFAPDFELHAAGTALVGTLTTAVDPTLWFGIRVHMDATTVMARVWQLSDTEPVIWQQTFARTGDVNNTFRVHSSATQDVRIELDNLVISGFSDSVGCPECTDALDFVPGYLPIYRPQFGDPTTRLDHACCMFESAAMALDWHTRGAIQVWGGELIPFSGLTEAFINVHGSNIVNQQMAWRHFGQRLEDRTGQTWAHLKKALQEGRAVVLAGDYGSLTLGERCQDSFEGNHGVLVLPVVVGDKLLVGDPLCGRYKAFAVSSLQAYAELLGSQFFGGFPQTPQPIFFAVTRPWTLPYYGPGGAPGLITQGNIDLNHRPVVHNGDGSISTVRSITIGTTDGFYLIPTVLDGPPRVVSNADAIAEFLSTMKHLGLFDTEVNADAYAVILHNSQETFYST